MSAAIPRILVIDDEPVLGRLIGHMLAPDHEVVSVLSGEAALARLAVDSDFDAILCDLWLPGLSGALVHEAVQHHWPVLGQRMVFVSGATASDATASFRGTAPRWLLAKPFTIADLREAVARVLTASQNASDRPEPAVAKLLH